MSYYIMPTYLFSFRQEESCRILIHGNIGETWQPRIHRNIGGLIVEGHEGHYDITVTPGSSAAALEFDLAQLNPWGRLAAEITKPATARQVFTGEQRTGQMVRSYGSVIGYQYSSKVMGSRLIKTRLFNVRSSGPLTCDSRAPESVPGGLLPQHLVVTFELAYAVIKGRIVLVMRNANSVMDWETVCHVGWLSEIRKGAVK